ncbi:MAG: crossover junction endodeoxyribonuclease RuvC [Planctomycetota bacterium]
MLFATSINTQAPFHILSTVVSPRKRCMMTNMADNPDHLSHSANIEKQSQCIILGIDPGLERTGYAFLSEHTNAYTPRLIEAGLIRLNRRQPLEQRLAQLAHGIETLIDKHQPQVLACEELYAHYRHPRTAILMAHARGVILAWAACRQLDVFSLAATHVKKVLTGSGRASKAQVQRTVAATLGLPTVPEPHDVADAIAIAYSGLRMIQDARRGKPTAVGRSS